MCHTSLLGDVYPSSPSWVTLIRVVVGGPDACLPLQPPTSTHLLRAVMNAAVGGLLSMVIRPSAPTGPVTTLISTVIEGNWMESAPLGQPGLRRCWWYLRFHCGGLHRWCNTLVCSWVIVGVFFFFNGVLNNLEIFCRSNKITTAFLCFA